MCFSDFTGRNTKTPDGKSVLPEIMSVITEIFPDSHSNCYIKKIIAKNCSRSPTSFPSAVTFFPVMQHFGLAPFLYMTVKSFHSSILLGYNSK